MNDKIIGKIGIYAFLLGTVIALFVGIWQAYTLETTNPTDTLFITNTGGIIAWVLVVLGAIVGLLAVLGKGTITKAEVPGFLTAGIALLVMYAVFSTIGMYMKIPYYIGSLLAGVSLSLALFIAPAVGILAVKAIWDIGKDV